MDGCKVQGGWAMDGQNNGKVGKTEVELRGKNADNFYRRTFLDHPLFT